MLPPQRLLPFRLTREAVLLHERRPPRWENRGTGQSYKIFQQNTTKNKTRMGELQARYIEDMWSKQQFNEEDEAASGDEAPPNNLEYSRHQVPTKMDHITTVAKKDFYNFINDANNSASSTINRIFTTTARGWHLGNIKARHYCILSVSSELKRGRIL